MDREAVKDLLGVDTFGRTMEGKQPKNAPGGCSDWGFLFGRWRLGMKDKLLKFLLVKNKFLTA